MKKEVDIKNKILTKEYLEKNFASLDSNFAKSGFLLGVLYQKLLDTAAGNENEIRTLSSPYNSYCYKRNTEFFRLMFNFIYHKLLEFNTTSDDFPKFTALQAFLSEFIVDIDFKNSASIDVQFFFLMGMSSSYRF